MKTEDEIKRIAEIYRWFCGSSMHKAMAQGDTAQLAVACCMGGVLAALEWALEINSPGPHSPAVSNPVDADVEWMMKLRRKSAEQN